MTITQELEIETERLLFNSRDQGRIIIDPTKSYLDYLKVTQHRSQRTMYDEPEEAKKHHIDSGINMKRIHSAIVDDYLTTHYSDKTLTDKNSITATEIMNGQLSLFSQMDELETTHKEKKTSATDYILGLIPNYIILGGRKFTDRKLIRVIYRHYVDRAKKHDPSIVKRIVRAIDQHSAIQIDMDDTNFIIASWKENGGE